MGLVETLKRKFASGVLCGVVLVASALLLLNLTSVWVQLESMLPNSTVRWIYVASLGVVGFAVRFIAATPIRSHLVGGTLFGAGYIGFLYAKIQYMNSFSTVGMIHLYALVALVTSYTLGAVLAKLITDRVQIPYFPVTSYFQATETTDD